MTQPETITMTEVTNGQIDPAHYGPTGDIARNIASYCQGNARAHVYTAAFAALTTARAEAEALRKEVEALRAERDQMRALAKANNDLAKMQKGQIQDLRQSQLRLMNDLQACKDALAQWEGRHEPE